MNKEYFMGNLTRDFEYRQGDTNVARGSMALNRGRDEADFVNVVAFGNTADMLAQYGKKGRRFLFECHIRSGKYTDKDGKTVYTEDHVIDKFEFADSKQAEAKPSEAPASNEFMNIPDGIDEELPFH